MSNYQLDDESLLDYAKCLSAIRRGISKRVEEIDDTNTEKVDEVSEKETGRNSKH